MWLIPCSRLPLAGAFAPDRADPASAAATIAASATATSTARRRLKPLIRSPSPLRTARFSRICPGRGGGTSTPILERMRICLVTPFAWSQPHDVNDHVAGVAGGLRALGHDVTVVAPSTRASDLLAGRRALTRGEHADVIAVGAAVPISGRSQMGVPVGVQANLALALAQGRFDVVHGFDPGLPSLSYLALRDSDALAVATFASPNRLGYPPARSQREKLLGRLDALIALGEPVREAAEERFPGEYHVLSPGVDTQLFAPGAKHDQIVVELRPNERVVA